MARSKPNYEKVWAETGSKTDPDVAYAPGKTENGWVGEIPIAEAENFTQNKQDQFCAHVNDYGIPTWDAVTEYPQGAYSRSLADPTKVFRSVQLVPAGNVDPDSDDGTYWERNVHYKFGSNANGDYRVWEDGLIEMWIFGIGGGGGSYSFTLPVALTTSMDVVNITGVRDSAVQDNTVPYWSDGLSDLTQVTVINDASSGSIATDFAIYIKGR